METQTLEQFEANRPKYMISYPEETYCGIHVNNQTIQGYILALEEFVNMYGKDFTYSWWVQTWRTSDDGGGHYDSYQAKGFDWKSTAGIYMVNRAFRGDDIKEAQRASHYFDNIPSGGYFNATGFINYLKEKYL